MLLDEWVMTSNRENDDEYGTKSLDTYKSDVSWQNLLQIIPDDFDAFGWVGDTK